LFWKYGLKRVTIEEICKESGVSKMTFYKFFPNKKELAKTVIEVVFGEGLAKWEDVVNGNLSFKKKIEVLFILKQEGTKDISMEFISDIYKNMDQDLQQFVNSHQQKSFQIFIQFLTDSQAKGLIRDDIKIDFVLTYMAQMSKMMENKELVAKYDHPQELIMESMNFLFYGLLPRK
ncbi:MAG: TetR/AcrR family transcriptional regulator, partial [Cyclobacteriaceae bacterium]|nr:TetR/AcrR family transcriptional regulator [Cyclobacteriaceae bacterium]